MVDEECAVGDLVFHFDLVEAAIIGCSEIAGRWTSEIVRGEDYWRVPLDRYQELGKPVSAAQLSARKLQIRKIQAGVPRAQPKTPSYLPFDIDDTGVKPRENYMAKFPAGIVLLFDDLCNAAKDHKWQPFERPGS
jgi:hypothetical protein